MGIHNEPGFKKTALVSLAPLIESCLHKLLDNRNNKYVNIIPGDDVVVLINNLGGVSNLEIGAVVRETIMQLSNTNIKIQRVVSGTLMTSLGMNGISISLLKLSNQSIYILECLNFKVEAPGWPNHSMLPINLDFADTSELPKPHVVDGDFPGAMQNPELLFLAVELACKNVIKVESDVTLFDTILGIY